MNVETDTIRSYRLWAHNLGEKLPVEKMVDAAGVCGLQNSPPGAWETALFNRIEGCSLQVLQEALCGTKTLLQAWSFRGVPVVFPTGQSDIFLTPLIAHEGERPWIYTLGITGALDYLQMPFDDLLERTQKAIKYLDSHTINRKEALDRTLAEIIEEDLPKEKQVLWRGPSMYGNPEKYIVGDASVSFLLRPCSFHSLVVFGQRQGTSPTFTSFKNWTGHVPTLVADAEKELVRKFLHAYGPATMEYFMAWLGCSAKQAKRLWDSVSEEIIPVNVEGKTHYMLSQDMDFLLSAGGDPNQLVLLGPHDPYLDLKDRAVILESKVRQKSVWKYVANPGAILKGGRVIGTWKTKTLKDILDVSLSLWEPVTSSQQRALQELAEEYAEFRLAHLRNCTIADT